jgi:hypothetical protein
MNCPLQRKKGLFIIVTGLGINLVEETDVETLKAGLERVVEFHEFFLGQCIGSTTGRKLSFSSYPRDG